MIVVASSEESSSSRVHADIPLKFGFARRTSMLTGAFRLVHDQYVARGYMRPEPSGLRLGLHHALPATKVFVARDRGRVVGTVTLIEDSRIGLPMDELYGNDLAGFRSEGRCLAEVSAMAVDDAYRRWGVTIVVRLIRLLLAYALELARHDDICIAVNPRHLAFYRRLFPDAHQVGEVKAYQKVNGAPAVALRLDLRLLRALLPALRVGGPCSRPEYEVFFPREEFPRIVARLRRGAHRSRLMSRQVVRLFTAHSAFVEAAAEDRAYIQSLYPDADLGMRARPTATGLSLRRHTLIASLASP